MAETHHTNNASHSPDPSDSETSPSSSTASLRPKSPRRAPAASQTRVHHNCLRTKFKDLSAVATIVVGGAASSRCQTTFVVHKELLTAVSPFFDAALNSTFAEGLDQRVELPEEKPEIFEWFLWWLYAGTLTTPAGATADCSQGAAQQDRAVPSSALTQLVAQRGFGSSNSSSSSSSRVHDAMGRHTHTDGELRNDAGSPKYFLLLDLYALSDRLLTTGLSNEVTDTIARLSETTNSVPTPSDTWILYGDTIRDGAPVRRLVLDLFAYKKTDKLLESHKDDWHPRFLRELVVKLKRPGAESVDRHTLVGWRATTWPGTRACEACRELVKPGVGGERCEVCERVFCGACVRARKMPGMTGEVGPCKPWLRGACGRYHEHFDEEVDACKK